MNKVILMGRLVKDVELKYTGNNVAVAKFTLAVNRKFAKQGEERKADFLNIIAWNKTGEFCSKYFNKGLQVVVCGRIETRTWDGEDGKRNYMTEVIADDVYFADKKQEQTQNNNQQLQSNNEQSQNEFYPVSEDDDELPF